MNNDESFELQNCIQHQRKFECFCTDCSTLICPSCLMFGNHKGHSVCSIEESMRSMRNELDDAAKEGLFKVENSEKILIEIRDIKLTLEDKKNKIVEEVEAVFSQLITALKERKASVLNDVNEHFSEQLAILNENENKWFFFRSLLIFNTFRSDNQQICMELLNLAKCKEDTKIAENANFIVRSIETLKDQRRYYQIKLINTIDKTFAIGKEQIPTPEEIVKAMKMYVKPGEIVNIQFRA